MVDVVLMNSLLKSVADHTAVLFGPSTYDAPHHESSSARLGISLE